MSSKSRDVHRYVDAVFLCSDSLGARGNNRYLHVHLIDHLSGDTAFPISHDEFNMFAHSALNLDLAAQF